MLSRHAEDLYWTGRYVERAEDTARMLDVTYHGLLEAPMPEGGDAWRELLEVLFLDKLYEGRDYSAEAITEFLVLDEDNAGSIVAAVGRARQNARGVRDRISTELWEAVNTFYLDLRSLDLRAELAAQPYQVYRMVKNRCQMIAGVAAESMPRDDGYRFMVAGRLLERAEMTCRLLAVRYAHLDRAATPMGFHWWGALLKSVSAFEAYLKEHRAALDPLQVLEFLLMSSDFPRSVLYCLRGTEDQLHRLGDSAARIPAQLLLGRVRARVEYGEIGEVVGAGLAAFLDELQTDIWRAGDAIDTHFFSHGADLDLHAYEAP